jgi:DNA invertase Pin-like site-specific DNA recombinase
LVLCIVAITAGGKLVFHLFAALAEFERGVTRGVKTGNTH